MAVDLRHFRSFVVVAEEGNIGRAATRLFITQPALSRQMQHLEEELGVALLVRVPRGVELTDAGHELLDKARAAPGAVLRRAMDDHSHLDVLVNNVGAVRLRLDGFLALGDEDFQ